MDLHNFFGSVEESRVYGLLRGLGYPKLLAFEMGRICTKPMPPVGAPWTTGRGIEAYDSAELGVLPQGAPTSGTLANAAAMGLDQVLVKVAQSRGLAYTRYSDDLTFSSDDQFVRRDVATLVHDVEAAILKTGFRPHRRKTRVIPPGARQIVLGLLLNEQGVRLEPGFRDRVDNHIRCVKVFGPAAHSKARAFDSTLSMINHVDGCLAFAVDIEPEWAAIRKQRWDAALLEHGHPVERDH